MQRQRRFAPYRKACVEAAVSAASNLIFFWRFAHWVLAWAAVTAAPTLKKRRRFPSGALINKKQPKYYLRRRIIDPAIIKPVPRRASEEGSGTAAVVNCGVALF